MTARLFHGTAYYPELWPEDDIEHDIAKMLALGINVVRMGEFAWAAMEPDEGRISLEFFRRVIDRLHAAGIATVFCTPTPTPPVWLTHDHPERLFVDATGRRMIHGSRQHVCTNNPDFRRHARRIVEAIATEFGAHPGLVAWQTDNEFKCHVAECHCEHCRDHWHAWLAKRYGTIDDLNAAWGTLIWSQRYQRFDQVPQPSRTAFLHHASLLTAYRRFSHESIAGFQSEHVAILRRHSSAPITHNSEPGFHLDNEILFRDLDFASFDHYPSAADYRHMLFRYDLFRTLKPARGFWAMETSPSHNGCLVEVTQAAHPPAFVAALAVSAYAQGAGGFSYWLWRQQRSGSELAHGAILSAWNRPTLGHLAAQHVDRARRALEPLLAGRRLRPAQVALTYSDQARHMWAVEPLASSLARTDPFDYLTRIGEWHDLLRDAGLPRDVSFPGASLAPYRLLVTPFTAHLPDEFRIRAAAWVEQGGTWIVGPLTSWRTAEHTVPTDAALGALEALAGVETIAAYPLSDTGAEAEAFGVRAPLRFWGTFFRTPHAAVLGTATGGLTPGLPFLTERRHGRGKIILLGAMPDGPQGHLMIGRLLAAAADSAGVTHRHTSSRHVAVSSWTGSADELLIAVNLGATAGSVTVPRPAFDALTGAPVAAGPLQLPAFGWCALRLAATPASA